MRRSFLPVAFVLTVLTAASAVAAVKLNSVTYMPPAETGVIYTVINFNRALGKTVGVTVNIDWGSIHRRFTVAPYGRCQNVYPAGFVLKLRHRRPDSEPLKLSTSGTIVRGPYQGDIPLEVLNNCYRLTL